MLIKKRGDCCGIADIFVSSVTYAMRGQRVLSANGIKSRIRRSIKKNPLTGCGYVLSVSEHEIGKAVQILKSNGIRVAAPQQKGGDPFDIS